MDIKDPKVLVEHIMAPVMVNSCFTQQVYDEILHLAYFLKGFEPNNMLEVGCKGGTFSLFSQLSTGKKVGVDIGAQFEANVHLSAINDPENTHFILGDSQTEETLNRVKAICPSFDFIFIDGDHTYEGVSRDFHLYKQVLSDRGVMVFHDIDPNHRLRGEGEAAGGEAYRFWQDLNEGVKSEFICQTSDDYHLLINNDPTHLGGLGFWKKSSY